MSIRPVKRVTSVAPPWKARACGCAAPSASAITSDFDPFLMMDDFRGDNPADYRAGFPWHPHRGIETITYVLAGTVEHGDSLGNHGKLGAGDVQWMTAGSGIMHQEMPRGDAKGRMHGFQLWANLPSRLKMTKPRYQDVPSAAIPEVTDDDGTTRAGHLRRVLGQDRPGRRRRRRAALSRCLGARGQDEAPQGRGLSPGLRLRVRGLGRLRRRLRAVRRSPRGRGRRRRTCWCAIASATARWWCSARATRSSSRRARRACASCSSRAGRCASRSPGTGRS